MDYLNLDEKKAASVLPALQQLLAMNGNQPLEFDETSYPNVPPVADYNTLYDEVIASDVALQTADAQVRAAEKEVSVNKQNWLPSIEVGYRRNTSMGEKSNGFLIGGSLPLFSNRKKLKIARAQASSARMQLVCHQFVRLVRENGAQEHHLPFYAGKLGISPRYLNDIVARYFDGRTPKQLIDGQLTAEIKVQLDNPLLTVSEIAEYFNFPDHTSMSRFFRRNTGMTPKEYRARRKSM